MEIAFRITRPLGWEVPRHFPDDVFKYIFLNENVWISIKILSKFFHRGPINNIGSDKGLAPTRQ